MKKKFFFFFVFSSKAAILRMLVLETLSRVTKEGYIAKEIVVFLTFATVKVRLRQAATPFRRAEKKFSIRVARLRVRRSSPSWNKWKGNSLLGQILIKNIGLRLSIISHLYCYCLLDWGQTPYLRINSTHAKYGVWPIY